MADEFVHPSDATFGLQEVLWNDFIVNNVYEMELISYYEAQTHPFGKGAYTVFCAKALNHYEQPVLLQGDVFKMHIAYREFVRALGGLHPQFRRALNRERLRNGNVYLKFQKISRQSMKILAIEPRENDGKYVDECAEVYLIKKFEKEVLQQ